MDISASRSRREAVRGSEKRVGRCRTDGYTLLELLIALALIGILSMVTVAGFRSLADSTAITGAVRAVHQQVIRARATAVHRRARVRVSRGPNAELELRDDRDSVLASVSLSKAGPFGIDSFRIRPATLRFNPRGQAAPGSIYLYRDRKGARVVINFLGRVRVQRFGLP
jgi:prepilin-type N-terminal cleavage/methylation domain-containing protein